MPIDRYYHSIEEARAALEAMSEEERATLPKLSGVSPVTVLAAGIRYGAHGEIIIPYFTREGLPSGYERYRWPDGSYTDNQADRRDTAI